MEIPWQSLDETLLTRLIEEVVTRDGTDYGMNEKTREQKIYEVKKALQLKQAIICWDSDTETASIQKI